MCNHFYDMDALVEAGPAGLAPIKNWQRARPRSSYAWLAEAQYWNHRAWLYRSYGWAQDTTRAMWICASACNERMVIAALYAIDLEPRQWMAASLTSTNCVRWRRRATLLARRLSGDFPDGILRAG